MDYEIAVIGASLGGLQAVREVLQKLPGNFPLPVVIVQHRDKSSDLLLSTYLQPFSAMDVLEICDKDPIDPGRVYLAPTDYHLFVGDGYFSLSTGVPVWYARPSIDVLFESAAAAFSDRTIGVLLTGANRDGAAGMKEIKRRGGLTIAQDPTTAECGVMPGSAISLGVVDKVLPLESIGEYMTGVCCGERKSSGTGDRKI